MHHPYGIIAVLPLHRTLDLDLCAKEQRRCTANLKSYLRLLRIVLNVRAVTGRNRRPLVLRRTGLCVAGLTRGWFDAGTQLWAPLDGVLLCHNLLALDPAFFVAGAARLGALGPFVHLPADGAVQHVAVLALQRRRLRAHVVWHDHRILAATRHLVNALDFALTDADAARLGTRRVLGVVPARRTRPIVARANTRFRLCFGRAEERRDDLVDVLAHTVDDQLFDAAQAGGTAAGVAVLFPHVRFARFRDAYLDRVSGTEKGG